MRRKVMCCTLKVAAFLVPFAIGATGILLAVSTAFRDAVLPAVESVFQVFSVVMVGVIVVVVSALVLGLIGRGIWLGANKVCESQPSPAPD